MDQNAIRCDKISAFSGIRLARFICTLKKLKRTAIVVANNTHVDDSFRTTGGGNSAVSTVRYTLEQSGMIKVSYGGMGVTHFEHWDNNKLDIHNL